MHTNFAHCSLGNTLLPGSRMAMMSSHDLITCFFCPSPEIQRCLWHELRVSDLHVEVKVEPQKRKQPHMLTRCSAVWLGQYTGMLHSTVAYTGPHTHPFRLISWCIYPINNGYHKTGPGSYKPGSIAKPFLFWCAFKVSPYVQSYHCISLCSCAGLSNIRWQLLPVEAGSFERWNFKSQSSRGVDGQLAVSLLVINTVEYLVLMVGNNRWRV